MDINNIQSTPEKSQSIDDFEDGLISLKLSSKKQNTNIAPRSRTNSKTKSDGRKMSLSPKKSMRFSIASNNKDFLNNSLVEESSTNSTPGKNENVRESANAGGSNEGNKLQFSSGNDMENLFLELAKRQRHVSELQTQLAAAEKSLKEWELHCQGLMSGPSNAPSNKSKAVPVVNDHGAGEVFSRWTSKIKATTDEILSLGQNEINNHKKESVSAAPNNNTNKTTAPSFFQSSFGKFTDIIHEFYEEEDDEKMNKEMVDMSHKKEEGTIFDKLKNKISEFSVINENEEDEFDKARSSLGKPDSMHYELIDHSGISYDGIHTYTGALSDSD